MTIRGDSFSSVAEVQAFTPHLLSINGTTQPTFNSTTRPTLTQLERFIDRASGLLNAALYNAGFSPTAIIANSTAKLSCDDWVTDRATAYAELTQRGEGFGPRDASRHGAFLNLISDASDFVKTNSLGFEWMGVTPVHPGSEGLYFTGLPAQDQRTDPTDPSLEQPLFARRQFNNKLGSGNFDNDDRDND